MATSSVAIRAAALESASIRGSQLSSVPAQITPRDGGIGLGRRVLARER